MEAYKQVAIKAYNDGHSVAVVAKMMRVSPSTAWEKLKSWGVDMRPRRGNTDEDGAVRLRIFDAMPTAQSVADVAAAMPDVSIHTIRRVMQRYGIEFYPTQEAHRKRLLELAAIYPEATTKELADMTGIPYPTAKAATARRVDRVVTKRAELSVAIALRIKLGMGQSEIARDLGISRRLVYHVIHFDGLEKPKPKRRGTVRPNKPKERKQVIQWLKEGVGVNECARRAKVTPKTVTKWRREAGISPQGGSNTPKKSPPN